MKNNTKMEMGTYKFVKRNKKGQFKKGGASFYIITSVLALFIILGAIAYSKGDFNTATFIVEMPQKTPIELYRESRTEQNSISVERDIKLIEESIELQRKWNKENLEVREMLAQLKETTATLGDYHITAGKLKVYNEMIEIGESMGVDMRGEYEIDAKL